MECTRCKSENPESNKFCGECGAALGADHVMQAAIRDELNSRLKDRDVVEVEVAEKVLDRLTGWGRTLTWLLGINIVILGATLSCLGVKSFNRLLDKAQGEAEKKMKRKIEDVSKDFEGKARAESEQRLRTAVDSAVRGFKDEVGQAQTQVKAQVASATAALQLEIKNCASKLNDVEGYLTAGEVCEEVTDSVGCHGRYPTGCSASGAYDAYLNLLKNELPAPPTSAKYLTRSDYLGLEAHLPTGLSRINHAGFKDQLLQLGEGSEYGVIGYL